MEGGGGGRRSPDRARVSHTQQQQQQQQQRSSTTTTTQATTTRPLKKVQVVYYLSRNGQLEHPHFMEVSHPPNQQLRLKDVLDKFAAVRGKGMPSLFSWSCKRSYKNGYVWNDLCENDPIYPSDGAEYVLKGSEIITGGSERLQHYLAVDKRGMIKPVSGAHKHHYNQAEDDDLEDEVGEIDDGDQGLDDGEYGDPRRASARAEPYARRSRGISTEGIGRVDPPPRARPHHHHSHHHRPMEVSFEDVPSPPSSSSSEKLPGGASAAAAADSGGEPGAGRSSVLLQLIACGAAAAAAAKGRSGAAPAAAAAAQVGGSGARKSGGLQRWMVSRLAGRGAGDEDELRAGSRHRPAVEEKEYFSGSIVEGATKGPPEPALKKSNSYNEERSSRLGIGEEGVVQNGEEREEGEGAEGAVKRKCIPGIKMPSSSAKQQQQQQLLQLQFQPKKGSQ